jgi:hypothetical protein
MAVGRRRRRPLPRGGGGCRGVHAEHRTPRLGRYARATPAGSSSSHTRGRWYARRCDESPVPCSHRQASAQARAPRCARGARGAREPRRGGCPWRAALPGAGARAGGAVARRPLPGGARAHAAAPGARAAPPYTRRELPVSPPPPGYPARRRATDRRLARRAGATVARGSASHLLSRCGLPKARRPRPARLHALMAVRPGRLSHLDPADARARRGVA